MKLPLWIFVWLSAILVVVFLLESIEGFTLPTSCSLPRLSHTRTLRQKGTSVLFSSSVEELSPSSSSSQTPSSSTNTTTTTTAGQQQKDKDSSTADDQVTKWRQEAARLRLQAEREEAALTLQKIATLQTKLDRVQKHPSKLQKEALDSLRQQIEQLETKLETKLTETTTTTTTTTVPREKEQPPDAHSQQQGTTPAPSSAVKSNETLSSSSSSLQSSMITSEALKAETPQQPLSKQEYEQKCPVAGFDADDLKVYLPICWELEKRLPTATLAEKMEAFRTDPALQDHFQQKMTRMLLQPMQDIQRMEELRSRYLYSESTKEKAAIKRQLEQLQSRMRQETTHQQQPSSSKNNNINTTGTATTILYQNLPPLDNLPERIEAVSSLPPTLQAVYKSRNKLPAETGNLTTAILLDYYDPQLQVLEHMVYTDDNDMRADVRRSVESLPRDVQLHFAKHNLEMKDEKEDDITVDRIVAELCKPSTAASDRERPARKWQEFHQGVFSVAVEAPEYDDIEFVDKSRYVKELYPALARLEGVHPAAEQVEAFMTQILDRKTFMVTSKPERVIGGYYIRGRNLISEDHFGVELTGRLAARLDESAMKDEIDFYYFRDPSPVSDENFEMGYYENEPLLYVTSKNATALYNYAAPLTKLSVSLLSLFFAWIFVVAYCGNQPLLADRIDATLASGDPDLSWVTDIEAQTWISIIAIQLAHETAHRIVAWKDKFAIGLPTPIMGVRLALQGAITPLKSPPPSLKSMFDFAIAGPLVGLLASAAFLVTGLTITATSDMSQVASLPALHVNVLLSSSLGGGLTEFFLGKGVLEQGIGENAVLPLHPFAIAGFVGLMSNSLALLPLGNTDGGRIALAMFGRRGAFIVKTFSVVLLCIGSLFRMDGSNVIITYVVFTWFWQRELETPARNEVEELDTLRGAVGISAALIVALALLPLN